MQHTLTRLRSTSSFGGRGTGRRAGAYRDSLRQHYRPAARQVPRWLLQVWLWC